MRQQILYVLGIILIAPLLPILVVMGIRLRRKIPRLPEAEDGLTGTIPGSKEGLKLLALGESTIAGVGVQHHRDGITGSMARALQVHTEKTVTWQVLAKNGYTAQKVREKIIPQVPVTPVDLIVIGLGGNETFDFNAPLTFRHHLILLLTDLRQKQPHCPVILANMPPVGEIPAFPRLFQLVLGSLVRLHGQVIRTVPAQFSNVYYLDERIRFKDWIHKAGEGRSIDDFFSDGVHPSALAYGIWGKEVVEFAIRQQIMG
jgi:lysophospholipase L1-like esterase